eukprot:jgi/Chlat1/2701/Chrsp180S02872
MRVVAPQQQLLLGRAVGRNNKLGQQQLAGSTSTLARWTTRRTWRSISSKPGLVLRTARVSGGVGVMACLGAESFAVVPRGWTERVPSLEAYGARHKHSLADPDAFWAEAAQAYHWETPFREQHHSYNFDRTQGPIFSKWFEGGKTNICYNALDRHIAAGKGDKAAFLWESNDGSQTKTVTYKELLEMVSKTAAFLKSKGVKMGDSVTIYMPMIPELPAAMLACARIGAIHSVVFGGFAADALGERIKDSESSVILTCSASARGKKVIPFKPIVDKALEIAAAAGQNVHTCLVYDNYWTMKRDDVKMTSGRDLWWQDVVDTFPAECPVEWVDSEAELFMLYTSGSTGKPKGVVHGTGGYMVHAGLTFQLSFDHKDDDVSSADCGWVTGHTYVTYGPLLHNATCVLFEGIPTYPQPDRYWQIIEKYNVSIFYTAPTVVRSLILEGDHWPEKYRMESLRILGTVGEPINPEAWHWLYEKIGGKRCPVVDTWFQTETGGHMMLPLPGAWPLKPGSATLPFFGVEPVLLDEDGNELEGPATGLLAIKRAWPGMMKTVRNDHARFEQTYFDDKKLKGYYITGDGCRRDEDSYHWITGRVDDVINVSGHRLGTAEIEAALTSHHGCTEAAVVGVEHPVKGQAVYAFCVTAFGVEPSEQLRDELKASVRQIVGAFAVPDTIHWAPSLPRTRSGKLLRRMMRKIANGDFENLGDTSTLAEPSIIEKLIKQSTYDVNLQPTKQLQAVVE